VRDGEPSCAKALHAFRFSVPALPALRPYGSALLNEKWYFSIELIDDING
jgi:hypothetical protein